MRILRTGHYRIVFLCARWAVKLPNFFMLEFFLKGWLCNIQEQRLWANARDASLCPVLHSCLGCFFIVMPKCDPLTSPAFDALDLARWKLLPVEEKMDSFGYWQGRIVAVDYGSMKGWA